MANVGSININLTAGTAQLTPALNAATGQLRQLGGAAGGAGGAMRAAGAEANLFEKGIIANTRSMDAFLINTLKMGPLIQAAFPVFGALALGAVLVDLTAKVVAFIKAQEEGPQKAAKAFDGLTRSLRLQDDELKVANARLEDQIAKLEGKPQNFLKLALEEDALAADKLGEHLAAANEKAKKVLEENKPGFLQSAAALQSSVDIGASWNPGNLEKRITADQVALDKINIARGQRTDAIRVDPKLDDRKRLEQEEQVARDTAEAELAIYTKTQKWLAEQKKLADTLIREMGPVRDMSIQEREARSYLALYSKSAVGLMNNNLHEQAFAYDQLRNTELVGKMPGAEADHSAAEEAKKDQEQINKLIGDRAKASEGELSVLDQIHAKMQERLREETETYNKNHPELGGSAALPNKQVTLINQTELAELAAAGTKITEEVWRGLIAQRAKVKEESLTALQKIDIEENESFDQLAARLAGRGTEPIDIPKNISPADYQKQTYDMARDDARMKSWHKYVEQQEKDDEKHAELDDKYAREAEERRKKAEEQANRISEIQQQADKSTAERQAGAMEKVVSLSSASGESKITAEYQIRLMLAERIHEIEQARIDAMAKGDAKNVAIAKEKADIAEANAKAEVDAELKLYELQVQHMKELQHAFDPLISALSDDIEKAMTGQKVNWGKSLQDAGHSMLQSGIHKALDFGMDKLFGKSLKPIDKWSLKPHVWVDNPSGDGSQKPETGGTPNASRPGGGGASVSSAANPLAALASLAPLLGGAGGGGADPNSYHIGYGPNFGGGKAEGGDVIPSKQYLVGENEAELFTPRSAGTITPLSKMGGGGGVTYNVDARYSSLGVENRIRREIQAAHASAVATSVRANESRKDRTPQRKN